VTAVGKNLAVCSRMLLYLNGATWTSGVASDALAEEVEAAMDARVRLLLCHEMLGIGQEAACPVEFDDFFATTPQSLLRRGVYDEIAVPLKAAPLRTVATKMLLMALADVATQEGLRQPTQPMSALRRLRQAGEKWSISRRARSSRQEARSASNGAGSVDARYSMDVRGSSDHSLRSVASVRMSRRSKANDHSSSTLGLASVSVELANNT
jgi:hypothetical protein